MKREFTEIYLDAWAVVYYLVEYHRITITVHKIEGYATEAHQVSDIHTLSDVTQSELPVLTGYMKRACETFMFDYSDYYDSIKGAEQFLSLIRHIYDFSKSIEKIEINE